MSPFELNLSNDLNVEHQRFVNKWLFPWHNINIPDHRVNVEDFRGGEFNVSGIRFGYSIREAYWQAITRYLATQAHEKFRKWDSETKAYPLGLRQSALEGTDRLLKGFTAGIIAQAVDTDRRLRGRGYPLDVPKYDASRERLGASNLISQLTDSYKVLAEAKYAALKTSATTRRLAAILIADVVGFSRMTQADEDGAFAALKSRRTNLVEPLVARHEGRIVKFMGDGVLIEFASAVNAVNCAAALQAGMAEANAGFPEELRIVLRMGINLGDVIVEDGDLYGDGVNIAARLEPLAEPGGILLSDSVYLQVRGKTDHTFEDLGERQLKNIGQPIQTYRLVM